MKAPVLSCIGLARISAHLLRAMEKTNKLPPKVPLTDVQGNILKQIGEGVEKLADPAVLSCWDYEDTKHTMSIVTEIEDGSVL